MTYVYLLPRIIIPNCLRSRDEGCFNCTSTSERIDHAGSSRSNRRLARIHHVPMCRRMFLEYVYIHLNALAAALKRDIIGLSRATCLLRRQSVARGRGDRR